MNIRTLMLLMALLFIVVFPAAGEQSAAVSPVPSSVTDVGRNSKFLVLLNDRTFDTLDRTLNEVQFAYERDTAMESLVSDAFTEFAVPSPELEAVFEKLLSSHPSSYAAHAASGMYYLAMAGAWRGEKVIGEIPQWKIDRMAQYVDKAKQVLKRSLTLTRTPTFSYVLLIRAARLHGTLEESSEWLQQAEQAAPFCVLPRNAFMAQLEPRWGGSYEAMQKFADLTGREQHPGLKIAAARFRGWIQWYRGMELYWSNDYVGALKYFNAALLQTEDAKFLIDRAHLYKELGQTELALADVNRVLELAPNNAQAILLRSIMLLDRQRVEEGMQGLLRLAQQRDLTAMAHLGSLYKSGAHGIQVNLPESINWFEKVAYFADAYACYQLGGMYAHGEGTTVNMKTAADYLKIAASLGNEMAMNDLGLMYWYGQGVPVNHGLAKELWVRAAEKDIWQARHNLRYFLAPHERVMLVLRHPEIAIKDRALLWPPLALIALLLILITMITRSLKRLHANGERAKSTGQQQ